MIAVAGPAERRAGAPGRGAQRDVAVADFALVRVAMLPYDAVLALVPAQFRAVLERAARATRGRRERCVELSQALHAVVPGCPDARTRRAVLALRRELFGGSVRDPAAALLLLESLALPPAVAELVARWSAAVHQAVACDAELSAQWTQARTFGLQALRALLDRPEIGAAVCVASPELTELLARGERAKRVRAELSLARYVTRAATKTSPFSSLTGVLPSEFGAGDSASIDLSKVCWTNHARVNRALLAAVDFATSDLLAAQPAARVVRSASLRAVDGARLEWLEPRYFAVLGRPWREARSVCVRTHPAVMRVLLELPGPVPVAEVADRLTAAGIDARQAQALIVMLLKRGALRNAAAPDAYAEDPDASLLERDGHALPSRFGPRIARLREHVRALADPALGRRDGVLATARSEADGLLESAGLAGGLTLKNIVLETCTGIAPAPVLDAGIRTLCTDVARVAQGLMTVNPIYGVLREFFLTTYGGDGRTDLATFIETAGRRCGDAAVFARLRAAAAQRAAPRVPAPFTVFGQPCSGAGGIRFVVNSIVAGTGQLAARYAGADTDGSGVVRRALRAWLARCADGALATDVTLAGDCNDLQAHAPITDRVLPWGADFVRPERTGVDRAGDLLVEYDADAHALRVRGRDGRLRALSYLGAVYLNAAYGPEYFLQALGQPYIVTLPDDAPIDATADATIALERIVVDGIVLRRAKWLLRTAELRSWFARGDVVDLVDIRLACERDGLPLQFFAKAVIAGARHRLDAPLDARKPQWIDTENPVCLALLRRLFDVSPWIEIVEMLPGRASMAVDADGLPHATELHFEIAV